MSARKRLAYGPTALTRHWLDVSSGTPTSIPSDPTDQPGAAAPLVMTLADRAQAVGAGRRAAHEWLRRAGHAAGDEMRVLVVVSELLTNAVIHARSAPTLSLAWTGSSSVLVEVHDSSSAPPAMRQPAGVGGGFGLRLVERLTTSWGWRRAAVGKVVWAAVDVGQRVLG